MISQAILLKQLSILLFSAVKLMVAAPVSYLLGYSYLHTLVNMAVGGVMGVVFFFFLSRTLFRLYQKYSPYFIKIVRIFPDLKGRTPGSYEQRPERKKIFNRRNRFIVKIRSRYGMPGIIILTPILLSIPLGTFLALKYYSSRPNLLAWLSLSVVVWSFLLTTIIEIL